MFSVSISLSDGIFAKHIAKILSQKRPAWQIFIDKEDCDVVINDDFFDYDLCSSKLISLIDDKEAENSSFSSKKTKIGFKNALFAGLTSAKGGLGLSSFGILLGRYLSRCENLKVLYLSLDSFSLELPENSKELFGSEYFLCHLFLNPNEEKLKKHLLASLSKDSYGLFHFPASKKVNPLSQLNIEQLEKFFSFLSNSKEFDVILLDVPANKQISDNILGFCEENILLKRKGYSNYAEDFLAESLKENSGNFNIFEADFDEDAKNLDILGQLGKEVRDFAKNLHWKN